MNTPCTHQNEVERWFDGEATLGAQLESHIEECSSCKEHVEFLRETRAAIEALPQSPEIADAQMPAFLEGISEGIHQPRRRFSGIWAMASGVAAALIAAVAMMSMLTAPEAPIGAESKVETYSTDIEGASVDVLGGENETQTVWLNTPDDGEI